MGTVWSCGADPVRYYPDVPTGPFRARVRRLWWIIEELARHGYKLSPGTLYPILHGLEHKGYLHSADKRAGRQVRRMYRATPAGRKALETAKGKVKELFGELFEEE